MPTAEAKPIQPPKMPKALQNDPILRMRVLSEAISRSSIAAYLGKSYSDRRDLYTALGYKTTPVYQDFLATYRRQGIAKAIVDRPVRSCWRRPPRLSEGGKDEGPFEVAWKTLVERIPVYSYFSRVDRVASIGSYGVLLLGLDDGGTMDQPVVSANSLLYLAVYSQANATISTYDLDEKSVRYNLPETYSLRSTTGGSQRTALNVHWSRVIHVAEDVLEDDVEGESRLEPVLNRLMDLDKIVGGSGEMFWRGAFPGYGFKAEADANIGAQAYDDVQEEIEAYIHDLQRYIRTQGMDIQSLAPQVVSPRDHVDVQLDMISAGTTIPKRILIGSERGELASSQDAENWNAIVQERQLEHCEARILRPTVDRLTSFGALPKPAGGYEVIWPALTTAGAQEQADVGLKKTQTLVTYSDSPGAESIMPRQIFMREMMNLSDAVIEEIDEAVAEQQRVEPEEDLDMGPIEDGPDPLTGV